MRDYSEDQLVEQPALKLLADLGWQTVNAFHEIMGVKGTLGRESRAEVVLRPRLKAVLERLNPNASPEMIQGALEQLTQDRGQMGLVAANRELYALLKEGVSVRVSSPDDEGGESLETLRVVDWDTPQNNDLLVVSQLWVAGELYTRRTDLVGFVNGLPLVLFELKAAHKRLERAFSDNLRDYKVSIPQLFWFNSLIVLSNGLESRVGSFTAGWEQFGEWTRIEREDEARTVSLETTLRGTCDPARLLDLVENFTLFAEVRGGLVKLLARNHQVLGVNNAVRALEDSRTNSAQRGKLGVFWHTQGSGKSYSMVFFSQKVLRKLPGNWSFVVVTDREDLDSQIYKTFADVDATRGVETQAQNASDLRRLLEEDHRYVFTLIQKFRTAPGEVYPVASERSNVIVMTDEAHRSQYDTFARNMRSALPNAAFLGFTGTPLLAGEEKTREVFGDYVSVYGFRDAVTDGATVPLFYENRTPELQISNAALGDQLERLLEDAELDEAQQARLEREFAREYQLITRDDRLEKVAQDLVTHFLGRDSGNAGKAMVISIDKATAVKMFNKVKFYWDLELRRLKAALHTAQGQAREPLIGRIRYLESTDMAVVVSQAQNEIEDFRKKGLDIAPHRRRMVAEDLEEKFKDPADSLRIVFVCAMWMTGFDAPSVSTLYLDKPMKNHTLMQTIARANRVWGEKTSGLIVDYVGVFRNLEQALAIYGTGGGEGDLPVKDKAELVLALEAALRAAQTLCVEVGVSLERIEQSAALVRLEAIGAAVEALLVSESVRSDFLDCARTVDRLYKALLPDAQADRFTAVRAALKILSETLERTAPEVDLGNIPGQIEALLDASVQAQGYVIANPVARLDLSKIDFEALAAQFAVSPTPRTETEKLKGSISAKLRSLVRLNKTRGTLLERYEALLAEYNAGSHTLETLFSELVQFSRDLTQEEARHVREGLSEEELAVYDLLGPARTALSEREEIQVKALARTLLEKLKGEKLVLDWRKKQQAKAQVRVTIEDTLEGLPSSVTGVVWLELCDSVYAHVLEAYRGQGQSVYGGEGLSA